LDPIKLKAQSTQTDRSCKLLAMKSCKNHQSALSLATYT